MISVGMGYTKLGAWTACLGSASYLYMVILRARVMRGRWAVPVSFVPITTLPMDWHWCDDAAAKINTHSQMVVDWSVQATATTVGGGSKAWLTDGGVVDWLVQAVPYHGLLEMMVLFLTLGGPTTATTMGGGSKGVRSTTGKWSFLVCTSSVRLTDRATRTVDLNMKAD